MATELRNRGKEERALLDLAVHLGLSREDRAEFSRIMEEKIDNTCMEAHTTFELHITKGVAQLPANARAIADEGAIKIEASAAHTMIKEKIALYSKQIGTTSSTSKPTMTTPSTNVSNVGRLPFVLATGINFPLGRETLEQYDPEDCYQDQLRLLTQRGTGILATQYNNERATNAVAYTHRTLPTNREV